MNDDGSARAELALIPGWQSRPATITPMPRSYNNRSYRVDSGDRSYVLRIADQADETGMRDFKLESRIQQCAAERDIASSIEFVDPRRGVMLSGYLAGRVWTGRDLQQGSNLSRLAVLLRTMHSVPVCGVRFAAAEAARRYVAALRQSVHLTDFALRCQRIVEDTPGSGQWVCCHNDIVAENVVDDGRLMLIDFEYARDNDPLFDLASVIGWHNLDSERSQALLAAYSGSTATEWRERLSLQLRLFDALQWLWLAVRQLRRPVAVHSEQLQRVAGRLA